MDVGTMDAPIVGLKSPTQPQNKTENNNSVSKGPRPALSGLRREPDAV